MLNLLRQSFQYHDTDITSTIFWIINYASQGDSDAVERVISAKFGPVIIENCDSSEFDIRLPAIKALGNILSGNVHQTELMLNLDVLSKISNLLRSDDTLIRKEAYWALSNITAGSSKQIERAVNNNVIALAMKGLVDTELEVRKEAGWVFSNICIKGHYNISLGLVHIGILSYLSEALHKDKDPDLLKNLIEIAKRLLKNAAKKSDFETYTNIFPQLFESSGCLDALTRLLDHGSRYVYEPIQEILRDHFDYEEHEEIDIQITPISKFQFS